MDWLKKIFTKQPGTTSEVSVVPARKPPPEPVIRPTFDFTSQIDEIFKNYIETSDISKSILFFDPEESNCYIYRLSGSQADILKKLTISEWRRLLPELKSYNNRPFKISDRLYQCFLCIYFTDLGERISVLLLDITVQDMEEIKEYKRGAIKLINTLKPATGLNQGNIDNLEKMILGLPDKNLEDLFDILEKDKVFDEETMQALRKDKDLRKTLSMPVPRKQMVKALARWVGVEYYEVELSDVQEGVGKKIPELEAKKYRVIPMEMSQGRIKAVFWNPFDKEAVDMAGKYLGDNMLAVMGCEEEIRGKLEELHHK